MNQNESNLNTLEVLHYFYGVFHVVFIPILAAGVVASLFFTVYGDVTQPHPSADQPIDPGFLATLVISSFFLVVLVVLSFCQFLAGWALGARQWWLFSVLVSALNCLSSPLGTLLGVFTLVVLARSSVKATFRGEQPLPSPDMTGQASSLRRRTSPFRIIIIALGVIAALLLGGFVGTTAFLYRFYGPVNSDGGEVHLDRPVTVTLTPRSPRTIVGGSERHFIDYSLHITRPGIHRIALDAVSQGDPYLALLDHDGAELETNDDSQGLNSLITRDLQPGDYAVRASAFSDIYEDVDSRLTVTREPDPPSEPACRCDALMRCCDGLSSSDSVGHREVCRAVEQMVDTEIPFDCGHLLTQLRLLDGYNDLPPQCR